MTVFIDEEKMLSVAIMDVPWLCVPVEEKVIQMGFKGIGAIVLTVVVWIESASGCIIGAFPSWERKSKHNATLQ